MKKENSLARLLLLLAALWLLYFVSTAFSACNPSDHSPSTQTVGGADYTVAIMESQGILMASMLPCDSVYYEPVAWGSEIRILNKTISHGQRRGFPAHWQAKGFVYQLIGPTRYQQDSFKERMVFADVDTIRYTDTFYICRKKIL